MNAIIVLWFAFLFCASAQDLAWKRAMPGWQYTWPKDHTAHPDFKTEWWYLTGNLRDADGHRFGYQLTIFRTGVRPPDSAPAKSRFVVNDLKFGHFTLTDVDGHRFLVSQQFSRGAFGDAGFGDGINDPRLAWLGDWSVRLEKDGSLSARGSDGEKTLELHLVPQKPWVIHGKDGVSIKAVGSASHYYSCTRMRSTGTLTLNGRPRPVEGDSWFDREWASDPLASDEAGWDWFSVQLEDGSDLMIYRMRRKDGTLDPATSGTFVAADGSTRALTVSDIEAQQTKYWHSKETGGDYPIGWKIRIAPLDLELEVTTPLENQELALKPVTYWEGMVDAVGKRAGKPTRGHGYLELTGYSGPIAGMSRR